MDTESSRRELLDDDLVELPLLRGGEQFPFFQYMLNHFILEFRLVLNDLASNGIDSFPIGWIGKKKLRQFGPLTAQILPDLPDLRQEGKADLLDLSTLFLSQIWNEIKISLDCGRLAPRAFHVKIDRSHRDRYSGKSRDETQ